MRALILLPVALVLCLVLTLVLYLSAAAAMGEMIMGRELPEARR